MVFAAELVSDFSVREECDRERRDVKERRVLEGSAVGIEGEEEDEEEEEQEEEEDMYDVYEGTWKECCRDLREKEGVCLFNCCLSRWRSGRWNSGRWRAGSSPSLEERSMWVRWCGAEGRWRVGSKDGEEAVEAEGGE